MNRPSAASDPSAGLLAQLCQAPPPPALRDRILRRHGSRRAALAVLPALALTAAVAGAWLAATPASRPLPASSPWQARSAELEATWRQQADPAWLREDARARALVETLRTLDLELTRAYAEDATDPARLDPLWRERSQTLAALIDSRRQGGVAVQL
jgi:hypothetical protein